MTYKASPIFHDGNKIVRLSDLPRSQSHLFSGWLQLSSYVVLGEANDFDCVKYDEYEYWYQNHYMMELDLDEML